jgi:hypothetical protein
MICWNHLSEHETRLFTALTLLFRKDLELFDRLVEPNKPRLSDSIENLLDFAADNFSAKQDVLFRVGMDLFSGSGEARVWELLEYLDNERLGFVLEALRYLGTKFNGWDGPVCRQLKMDSDNSRRQLKLDIPGDL